MDTTILIVEDEKNINDILSYTFTQSGYKTLSAYDGTTGLEMALNEKPDLVLLDVNLPGMDGMDVCKEIRKTSDVPILMLTAREDEVDKVLGLEDLTADQIKNILSHAAEMKKIVLSDCKKIPNLQGKTVVNLFYENSTRTRTSFELAAKYMGANATNISSNGSSVAKGESLIDTAETLDSMGTDILVMRHSMSGAPNVIAPLIKASVINAGDGMHEHPTQALLDMLTMIEHKGGIEGLKVAIIGDVYHSRVVRSNVYGLTKLGAEVTLGGPATLMPKDIDKMGVRVFNNVQEAIMDADVVMALRIQLERQKKGLFPSVREYFRFFGVDESRLKLAKPDAIVMHPGPVNRGVELSSSVIDGDRSVITQQVTSGVAVRMAVMDMLIHGGF